MLAMATVLWLSTVWAQDSPGTVVASYKDGRLSINARNAPLIEVLRVACQALGAQLEAPADAVAPILTVLGPAPASEIFGALLGNSGFNYAISKSASDPNGLASVFVLPNDSERSTLPAITRTRVPLAGVPPAVTDPVPQLTSVSEGADSGNAEQPAQPSKAELAALAALERVLKSATTADAGSSSDSSAAPVQRDSGFRQPHRRP